MGTQLIGFVEMLLVFGGLLGVLVWQLWSLKRDERKQKSNDRQMPR